MKKILLLGLIGLMGFMGSGGKGQNLVVYSTGFEVGEDTAWTLVGGPNRWHIGSAVADSGSRSLYVSNDGGVNNAYTNTNVTCAWAYRDVTLSGGIYRMSYRWRSNGEQAYDYLRVALVPDTVQPDTTMITDYQSARNFAENLPEGWICLSTQYTTASIGGGCYAVMTSTTTSSPFQTFEKVFTADSGNWRLVCIWVNDPTMGGNPPAAVDNIELREFGCQPVASLEASVVGYDSVYMHWIPAGTASSWLVLLNDSIVATVSDTTYGFNHLAMLTDYMVSVRALCQGGDTTEAVSVSLHTGGYIPLPYSENFDGVANNQMPAEWTTFVEDVWYGTSGGPQVQQHELNFYRTQGDFTTAVTPLLQGPANRWRISFDVWMQASRTHDFGVFGPFEVQLVADTNHIDSTVTLLTVAGGENAGWHNYTFATDSLTTYGGPAWLLFRWRGNYCRLKVDNLVVQSLNDSLPHVLVSGPTTVLPEDTATFSVVHDDFYVGSQPHDTVVWQSTMAQSGSATIIAFGDSMRIVYAMGGTDTLTAYATNTWGTDTATFTVEVPMCPHITMPFEEDFENGMACWKNMSTDGTGVSDWRLDDFFARYPAEYGGSIMVCSSFASGWERNAWLVSPAIEIPADSHDVTLSFRRGMVESLIPTSNPAPTLQVLVSTTGRYSTLCFTDTLLDLTENNRDATEFSRTDLNLDAYAGQTIWIAFCHVSHSGTGIIWLDDIKVRNDLPPMAELSVPAGYERTVAAQTGVEHPVHMGDAVIVTAGLRFGNNTDVDYTWHSNMVDAGYASMMTDSNVLTINYLVEGVDTISVVADNHFGIDTAFVAVTVIDCYAIDEFPYSEKFHPDSTSPGCWQVFNSDTADNVSVWISVAYVSTEEGSFEYNSLEAHSTHQSDLSALWVVSPQIAIPNDSLVYALTWQQWGPDVVYVSPMGCDETVCFTDSLHSTSTVEGNVEINSVLLGDYAGQTIRLGFVAPKYDDPAPWLISLDEVNIFATDSVRVGIAPFEGRHVNVYSSNGRIFVDGTDNMEVQVYDMMGRMIQSFKQSSSQPISKGVYLVKVGSLPARKVVVMQ
jgi:hypothetical protein